MVLSLESRNLGKIIWEDSCNSTRDTLRWPKYGCTGQDEEGWLEGEIVENDNN